MGAGNELFAGLRGGTETEVWACNWQSVQVMVAMGSQWRTGMAGATGLDYAALPAVFDLLEVAPKRRKRVFADLRVMESAVLAMWAERSGK